MNYCKLIFGLFTVALCSQELPPIQNYSPSEYGAENQNWAISQSEEKLIYVANNEGLLEFNGANWNLFTSPNHTILRSVKAVGDRIYMGCYMEFGYWSKNAFGGLAYTSLSKEIREELLEDEEFWNILDVDDWILFQSKKRIYTYNLKTNTVTSIAAETSLPGLWRIGQSVFFHRTNHGLYRIDGGREVLVYDQEPLKNDEVIALVEHDSSLMVLTRRQGFFKIDGDTLTPWETQVDPLLGNGVYCATVLSDKKIAVGTIADGFILLDRNGTLMYHINQPEGLRNNTVLSLYEDQDSNIWLGLDSGVSYINRTSPFMEYNSSFGDIGSVYTALVYDDHLYVGTNQGLFYKKMGIASSFTLIKGTQGQVWDLKIFDNVLFCGHHNGTYSIKEDRAKKIASIPGTWNIGTIANKDNFLIQGNYDGLYILERKTGTWQLRNKIKGFNNSSRYVAILNDQIFVNHEYKGVFTIKTDSAYTKALSVTVDTLIRGDHSGMVAHKGRLLYANKGGVFSYDEGKKRFIRDSTLSTVYSETEYESGKIVAEGNRLWFFTKDNLSQLSSGSVSKNPVIRRIPLNEDIRDGIVGYETITPLAEKGTYLFGNSLGYLMLNTNHIGNKKFDVHIGQIAKAVKKGVIENGGYINKQLPGNFKSYENNLAVSFYTAHFEKYTQPKYQFRLKGLYPDWSEWSENAAVVFENLPRGDYTFGVRSRIGDRISSNVASYSFTINPPWYRSTTAWIIYFIGGILSFFLIHSAYKRYYKKRQHVLVQKNQREMALAKAQNEKEIIALKNEQLKKEFKNKSNELAASTMSIIKKNKLLLKAKDQLLANVSDKQAVKPIIKVIDQSLNQHDDWELFKEAFNNADRKFLKKLKKAHPNLTPNDIRLCAYLRLNLSSKEIAPLFNISARSVEIKRYRLRKKMNLTHDENLVNYILKL